MRHWTSRILGVILLSLVCSAESESTNQGDDILLGDNILLKNGFVFVDAFINGQGPFRMLVDTGSTTSFLAPEAATEARLAYDHRVVLSSLSSERPLPATSTAELRVGTTTAGGVEIVVTPIAQLRKIDRKARGVLGQSFLGRSAYLIDYARKKLWLGGEARRRSDELPLVLSGRQVNGRTILPVTLQAGRPSWNLTLDSGASNLLVKCTKRCPAIADSRSTEQVMTLVGERSVLSGTLMQAEVAGARISHVRALLVGTDVSDGQDDGVIPSQWFSAVYVDGNSGLVRLAQRR